MLRIYRNVVSLPILLILTLLAGCNLSPVATATPRVNTAAPLEKPTQSTPGLQVTLHVLPTHPPLPPTPTELAATPTPAGKLDVFLPQPDSASWIEWAGGFRLPVDLAFLPNAPGVAYVLQQEGQIAVVDNGQVLPQPLLDLTGIAVRDGNEQGLLGIALDPLFSQNRTFYLNYTDRRGDTVIASFQTNQNFLTVDPASQKILLQVGQPYANHNGGSLAFGPDGFLYIALGDGGSANDPQGNGQNLDTLLGKILRIDVRGEPYAIPADNPYTTGGGRLEIWASGLRNPWKISFDSLRGDLYIADVGQGSWEEINVYPNAAPGGLNFGWDLREGSHPFEGTPAAELALAEPVVEYSHAEGGCSVTGGFVYRGTALPDWQGVYLYGDYCTGIIWGLAPQGENWQNVRLFDTDLIISSFGQDMQGEIYLLDHQSGRILKLVP
jgi:glucose/arabinose dehydrogenase